jgi:hypothetical protein
MSFMRALSRRALVVCLPLCLLAIAWTVFAQTPVADALFDIVLPWDDGSETAIDAGGVVPRTIADDSLVRTTADGHLAIAGRRARFWGVNVAFGASFPEKTDAEHVAARMEKFGVNMVRFHHMDMHSSADGSGIWTSVDPDRTLDPAQLDRLDFFVAQLKRHGIYVDLNLLVSRPFSRQASANLPADLDQMTKWKQRAVLGFFDDAILQLQKDYARDLLTHVNAYTGKSYAQEPVVGFIEINNENGLVQAFLNGQLDDLPPFYRQELVTLWNNWLRSKYRNHEALITGWSDAGNGVAFYPDERLGGKTGMRGFLKRGEAVARSENARKDWFRFLLQTEERYWRGMRDYLKETLGTRALLIGTIVGCSTPNLMAQFDVIDTHAYWEHPTFPDKNKPWDAVNWFVKNEAMVNHPDLATVGALAMRGVLNKPHIVTEYNHPHPNTFEAEAFPFLATYGALQDFDAVFAFDYASDKKWDARAPVNFFSVQQHPLKMATFIPSATAFLRGDIAPARDRFVTQLTRENEVAGLLTAKPWQLVDARTGGVDVLDALTRRVAIAVEGQSIPSDAVRVKPRAGGSSGQSGGAGQGAAAALAPAGGVFVSDTGQIRWDTTQAGRGYVTVDTPGTKLLYGFIGERSFDLTGGVGIKPKATLQQGFAVIGLTSMDAPSLTNATRVVITAVGTGTTTGAGWRTHPNAWITFPPPQGINLTLQQEWGTAPFRAEGIGATITLPFPSGRVRVWSLDPTGAHARELPVAALSGGAQSSITIQAGYKALWYEAQIKPALTTAQAQVKQ